MRKIDALLNEYGESHQHGTNKFIHWICVPLILFSLIGIVMHIPFPWTTQWYWNWGAIFFLLGLLYYLRLSVVMFVGFIFIAYAVLWLNYDLIEYCQKQNCNSLVTLIGIFILAWLGQFYGHYLEGKKPSFLKDIQFLLIGPAWLLSFIFKKLGIPY